MKQTIKNMIHVFQLEKENVKFWCEILTGFATVISAIIVLLTLREMQIQRNNAYMPEIIFETVSAPFSWGTPQNLDVYGSLIDDETELNPSSIKIPVRNIGVGVAKKISITITDDNYISWLSLFNKLNPENQYTYTRNGSMLTISNGTTQIVFNADYQIEKTFLLPNAEEIYEVVIPIQYTKLLQEISSIRSTTLVKIPSLEVNVSFEDVQGIAYNKKISLNIESYFLTSDSDGNGMAIYQIVME